MLRPKSTIFTAVQDLFKSEKRPLLLSFYKNGCDPCREQKPVLAQVAQEFHDTVAFIRVDVEEQPELANAAGIKVVPVLVVISEDRKQGGLLVGKKSHPELRRFVEDALTL